MKKTMKKWLSVCMVLVLAFAMTGCGDDKQVAKDTGDAKATEAPATEAPAAEEKKEEPKQEEPADDQKDDAAASGLRLVGGEVLLEGTSEAENETNADGSYYINNQADDGMLAVYQQGGISLPGEDVTEEEYALNLANGLCKNGANDDAKVKPANDYSANVSYPVYVASFTSGSNEDTAEWWVFITYTDSAAYLYGICTPIDAENNAGKLADETFPNLKIG